MAEEYIKERFSKFELELSIDDLLVEACSHGILEYIKKYLKNGANIHGDTFNKSPIYNALGGSNPIPCAELLLEMGADVNIPSGIITDFVDIAYSEQELHYFGGNTEAVLDFTILKWLLKHGADINLLNPDGESIFDVALRGNTLVKEMINFLIENGANINIINRSGKTILDVAISRNSKYTQFLKDKGAKTSEELETENN